MASLVLRPPPSDNESFRFLADWHKVLTGLAGGRLKLAGDDGIILNPVGGAVVSSGNPTLWVASNYPLLIQDAATNNLLVIDSTNGVQMASLKLTTSLSIGTTPAASGDIRLSSTASINARNDGNTADLAMISRAATNVVLVGDIANTVSSVVRATTSVILRVGTNDHVTVANASVGIGTPTDILAFYGAAGATRPTALTQTYATSTRTVAAYTTNAQAGAYTGIATGVGGTPYAQLTDLNLLRLAYENLRLAHDNTKQVLNALIDDMQAVGLES